MLKVLELFGGYGSQALALENLGIVFKSDLCEIDKYAIKAYEQLHGETFNYGDICGIDETKLPYYDLITYSSPCQDFSAAGKQAGGDKGSGTRSSLLWECERIIKAVKPKYLLMENVKALTSKKFMPLFQEWLSVLESLGYKNWWKILNAKDFGVPQNRERVFVVSILGDETYEFPEPVPLTKTLKDILEPCVDEKYFISKTFRDYIDNKSLKSYNFRVEISKTHGIRDTPLRAFGDRALVQEPLACASRGRPCGDTTEQRLEINKEGVTNALTTVQKDNYVIETKKIRRLTPRECWRLMGVRDEQFDKLHDISDTQLYKMAGNSIVVNILMKIFKNLLTKEEEDGKSLYV
jgi:DNA (cytosine-5)-methyltransferase 1